MHGVSSLWLQWFPIHSVAWCFECRIHVCMEWYGCFIVNGTHVKSLGCNQSNVLVFHHAAAPIHTAKRYGFIAPLGEGDKGFYDALLVATEQDVVFKTPKVRRFLLIESGETEYSNNHNTYCLANALEPMSSS